MLSVKHGLGQSGLPAEDWQQPVVRETKKNCYGKAVLQQLFLLNLYIPTFGMCKVKGWFSMMFAASGTPMCRLPANGIENMEV